MTGSEPDLLVQVLPSGAEQRFQPGQQVLIGRDTDVHVTVVHPRASRRHAVLTCQQGGWVLTDQSSNGTFMDGRPVRQMTIYNGITIRVGDPDHGTEVRLATVPSGVVTPPAAAGYPQAPAAPLSPAGYAPAPPAPVPAAGFAAPPAPGYGAPPVPPDSPVPGFGAQAAPAPGLPPAPGYGAPAADYGPPSPAGYGAPPGNGQPDAPPGAPGGYPPGAYPPGAYPPGAAGQAPAGHRGGPGQHGPHGSGLVSSLHILLPIRSWLHNRSWRQGLRLLVIAYGLLPNVFIIMFGQSTNLSTPGWAYSLYLAPLWLIVFYFLIRPGSVTKEVAVIAVLIAAATLLLIKIMTEPWEQALIDIHHPRLLPPWIYGVGYAEEVNKALPVLVAALVLLYFRKQKLDVRMWMLLGTVAGLTFGVAESARYTTNFLQLGNQHTGAAVPVILLFSLRVFLDGFQHAVWAGISAFFIGMGINYRRQRVLLILIGISIPSVLHGLNDWVTNFSNQWLWLGMQAISLLLFLGYTMSAADIEQEVRKTPAFRGDSMLMERPSFLGEVPRRVRNRDAAAGPPGPQGPPG